MVVATIRLLLPWFDMYIGAPPVREVCLKHNNQVKVASI